MDESFDKMEIFEYLDNPNNMIRIIAAGETAWKAIDGITISDHHEVEGYSTEKFTNDSFRFDETTRAVIVVADSISSEVQEFLSGHLTMTRRSRGGFVWCMTTGHQSSALTTMPCAAPSFHS